MADKIQIRRDTAARWAQFNPVLSEGEMGLVTDSPNQYKVGDGVNAWNALPLRGYDGTVTQGRGYDSGAVMSQDASTKEFNNLDSNVQNNLSKTLDIKNLIDVSKINYLFRYSPGSGSIIPADINANRMLVVPVLEGKTYVVSDLSGGAGLYGDVINTSVVISTDLRITPNTGTTVFSVPTGRGVKFVVLNILTNSTNNAPNDPQVRMNEGTTLNAYEPFTNNGLYREDKFPERLQPLNVPSDLISSANANFCNPKLALTNQRLNGNQSGATQSNSDNPQIVTIDYTYLKAGDYCFSGNMFVFSEPEIIRAFYYPGKAVTGAVKIQVTAVTGGWKFTMPNDGYIRFDVKFDTINNKVIQPVMLNEGDSVLEYVPYYYGINEKYLPDFASNDDLIALKEREEAFEKKILYQRSTGKNFVDPSDFDFSLYYSPSAGRINPSAGSVFAISGFYPAKEGEWISVSAMPGDQGAFTGGFFASAEDEVAIQTISFIAVSGGYKFQIPIGLGVEGFRFNGKKAAAADKQLAYTYQAELGEVVTVFEAYDPTAAKESWVPSSLMPEDVKDTVEEMKNVFVLWSKNKLNPADVMFDRRYSTGSGTIIAADTNKIALGTLFPVEEGKWYTAWGDGIYSGYQGGFYDTNSPHIGHKSIQNISWIVPVSGPGRCFQVPLGLGIKYACVSLATNDYKTALAGNAMVEEGEMATTYSDYDPKKIFNPAYVESEPAPEPTETSELEKYTTFGNLSYSNKNAVLKDFIKHWLAKDKDLCVVNTGTSLTARSSEHCTEHSDRTFRPPLMQSNNFASHIWDALAWDGQQYRRYDYENSDLVKFFTEGAGTWATATNLDNWDDGAYRYGLTRYSDDVATTLGFKVPIDAWRFNFIFRTDSLGSENCKITIAEGNGMMEVLDPSDNVWKEANNFIFSMREAPVITLPSITYKDPNDGVTNKTFTNYQVKGNTTYQKRLYMRCKSSAIDSRNTEKNISISRTSGRLLYWGVEWTPREFMITYINAARGSHSSAISSSTSALNHYQDNEVWNFKPDLFLSEDPIHNAGAAGKLSSSYTAQYFGNVTENFFFADNGISMKARCQTLGLDVPLFCLFNSTITWNFGGIDEDGKLILSTTNDGRVWTALDAQMSCYSFISEKHPEAVYINAVKHFVEACFACYGSMKLATIGSGKAGLTFTNEGSHCNDTGSKVMARAVLPILEFFVW